MSKPKRIIGMSVPLYGIYLRFICGAEQARKQGFDMADQHLASVCYDYAKCEVTIILRDETLTSRNTLAHETLHAAWRVLDMVGAQVDAHNHEALAYLVGWIAEELDKWALPLAEQLRNES